MYKNAGIVGFDFMDNAKDSMKKMKGKTKKKIKPEKDGGFFSKVSKGGSMAPPSFLGPTHNYAKEILAPQEMRMRPEGSMDALAANVSGIIAYTDVLVSGDSKAQKNSEFSRPCEPKTGKYCSPLGNSFFLETGGKCKDSKGKLHKRWMYINNKPTGAIPFISDMTGKNTPGLRGLIPGAIENLGHINPLAMQAYDKYFKLAQDFNLTMVQLAQSFVNSRPFVTSNIIGATTMEQVKENVESINIEFTDEMMDKVNEIHNNNPNPSP